MSSSVHADNKKEDVLIFLEGPTQGLNDTTVTGEKKYLIDLTENNEKICLNLHYNEVNINLKRNYIVAVPLFLGNI